MAIFGSIFALFGLAAGMIEPNFTQNLPAAFGPVITGMSCYLALSGALPILSEQGDSGVLSGLFSICFGIGISGLSMAFQVFMTFTV